MTEEKKVVYFQVGDMLPLGLTLVVTGIALAYGLNVMGDISEDTCETTDGGVYSNGQCYVTTGNLTNAAANSNYTESSHFNATQDGITGVAKLPEKLPLIATVIVAAIILGIVVRYLAFQR